MAEGQDFFPRPRQIRALEDTQIAAISALWKAATDHWVEELEGEPRLLADQLFDSSTAYPGAPIRGKELYRIGVELGFVEERKHE